MNNVSTLLVCTFLGAFTLASGARAQTLNESARLRKISLSLRGELPSQDEFNALTKLSAADQTTYVDAKIDEYVSSQEFRNKFIERVMRAMRFNRNADSSTLPRALSGKSLTGAYYSNENYADFPAEKSFVNLLTAQTASDQAWDKIVGAPEYLTSVEVEDTLAALQAQMVEFYDMNLNLQSTYRLSRTEATEVLLGVRQIPTQESDEVKQILAKLATLDARSATAAEKASSPSVKYQIATFAFYRLLTMKKITTDEYNAIKSTLDAQSRAQGNIVAQIKIFGTANLATQKNVHLYDTLMEATINNRSTYNNDVAQTIARLLSPVTNPWRTEIMAKTLEKMKENPNSTGLYGFIASKIYTDRFNQTLFSKSAALFRTFMCDDMKPVALGGVDLATRAGKGILPFDSSGGMSRMPVKNADDMTAAERHASQPACQTCHRKLDPAQSTFDPAVEISESNPLTFVYDDELGKEQRVQIKSRSEVVSTLQQQRAYKVCQIRKFWNWYIGPDVPLTESKLNQLLPVYENNTTITGLVKAIVSRSEFKTAPDTITLANFETVRPVFQRCANCHRDEPDVASFVSLPFSLWNSEDDTSPEAHKEHLEWLHKIVNKTQVFHGGRDAKMPPVRANWVLDPEQLQTINNWLYNQARDSEGKPTINESERDELFSSAPSELIDALSSKKARAPQFGASWLRYLEGHDFIRVLYQVLPNVVNTSAQSYQPLLAPACGAILNASGSFGYTDQMTGDVQSKTPTFGFLSVWSNCVSNLVSTIMGNGDSTQLLNLTGYADIKSLAGEVFNFRAQPLQNEKQTYALLSNVRWEQLTPEGRHNFIGSVVDRMVGPGVLRGDVRERTIARLNDSLDILYGKSVSNSSSILGGKKQTVTYRTSAYLSTVLQDLVTAIATTNEFLSF